jgi:hypothetical protein
MQRMQEAQVRVKIYRKEISNLQGIEIKANQAKRCGVWPLLMLMELQKVLR